MRSRQHQCNGQVERQTLACGNNGVFLEWTLWSSCTQSCAGGKQRNKINKSIVISRLFVFFK